MEGLRLCRFRCCDVCDGIVSVVSDVFNRYDVDSKVLAGVDVAESFTNPFCGGFDFDE